MSSARHAHHMSEARQAMLRRIGRSGWLARGDGGSRVAADEFSCHRRSATLDGFGGGPVVPDAHGHGQQPLGDTGVDAFGGARTVRSGGYPGLESQPIMDALLPCPRQPGLPHRPGSGITHPGALRRVPPIRRTLRLIDGHSTQNGRLGRRRFAEARSATTGPAFYGSMSAVRQASVVGMP